MGKMISAIDNSLLEPIGLVTVNFSMLEGTLKFFVRILITNEPMIGQIITANLNFRQLIDLFCSLYRFRIKDDVLLSEFEQFRKSLEEANDRRNNLIHSQWAAGEEPGKSTKYKTMARAKQGLIHKFDSISTEDIMNLAEYISEIAADAQDLMIKTLTSKKID